MKTANINISVDYLDAEDAERMKDNIIGYLRKNPDLFSEEDYEIYERLDSYFNFLEDVDYRINDPDDVFDYSIDGIRDDICDFQRREMERDFQDAVLEMISQERRKRFGRLKLE